MYKTAAALIVLCSIAPAHSAEVYRCLVNGQTRYEEQPCSGMVLQIDTQRTGVSGLRDTEIHAYLDSVERDVYRIGPRQVEQLETVRSHMTILRQLVD